jgi:hypothetical protein
MIEKVVLDDGLRTIDFEVRNPRNFALKDQETVTVNGKAVPGSIRTYQYDANSNNTTMVTDNATGTSEAGGYPSCTDLNRKTCNLPTWTKRNGITTSYTYHEPSGQVLTVTYPADNNGISKVVRYGYGSEMKFANYIKTNGGSKTKATDGIWLKTTEKTCNNTATVNDRCAGNPTITPEQDEVIKSYEYNNDNLLLTGMTVTAYDGSKVVTKRTCYQYDIYGNRIGETQPNAQLFSCTP